LTLSGRDLRPVRCPNLGRVATRVQHDCVTRDFLRRLAPAGGRRRGAPSDRNGKVKELFVWFHCNPWEDAE